MMTSKLKSVRLATFEDILSVNVAVMFDPLERTAFSLSQESFKYFCAYVGFQFDVFIVKRSAIVPVFLT